MTVCFVGYAFVPRAGLAMSSWSRARDRINLYQGALMMTHRDRAGDPAGHRAGSREAAGDAGHRQGLPTPPPNRPPAVRLPDRNGGFPKSCGPGLSGGPILVDGAHGLRCPASLRHALPRRVRLGHQAFGVTAPDWIPARFIPPRNLGSPKASRSCSAPEPHEWTVRRRSILETGSSGRSFRSMLKPSKEHEAASFSLMASLRPENRRHCTRPAKTGCNPKATFNMTG